MTAIPAARSLSMFASSAPQAQTERANSNGLDKFFLVDSVMYSVHFCYHMHIYTHRT